MFMLKGVVSVVDAEMFVCFAGSVDVSVVLIICDLVNVVVDETLLSSEDIGVELVKVVGSEEGLTSGLGAEETTRRRKGNMSVKTISDDILATVIVEIEALDDFR